MPLPASVPGESGTAVAAGLGRTGSLIVEVLGVDARRIEIGRQARLAALGGHGDHVPDVLYIPEVTEPLSPLLTVVPLQLMAYYAALARGHDVDKPRNLAKSVTVE